ncbi:MAG: class I SAM-dependent methyltransferase [Pseudomonadota bacterium]
MLNTFQQQPHDLLPSATHDERSRQEFAKSLKGYVQQGLLPGLAPVYQKRLVRYEGEHGAVPKDRRETRRMMIPDAYFQTYASANRVAQELLWESVLTAIQRQQPELNQRAQELSAKNASPLAVDPAKPAPRYVTGIDIHCMPGGYADATSDDDVSTGALYDRGVYLYAMGYMGPTNDDMGRSVCNYIRRNMPDFAPKAILDMGCTVGHSTLPYKEQFADAEVTGIDVAAPQLRYAHARAGAMGLNVGFMQEDASQTSFADGSFDLIVSHILLHETSAKAMPAVFRECFRLLKPGGVMIHADLPPFDHSDLFSEFILDNETHYNNEPFWGAMRDMDQIQLAVDAGFVRDQVRFDTAPMAVLEFAAAQAEGYSDESAEEVADRDFKAGEYAPGGGWEVLIGVKGGDPS